MLRPELTSSTCLYIAGLVFDIRIYTFLRSLQGIRYKFFSAKNIQSFLLFNEKANTIFKKSFFFLFSTVFKKNFVFIHHVKI